MAPILLYVDLIAIVAFLAILLGIALFGGAALSYAAAMHEERRGRGRSAYLVPKVFAGLGSALILASLVALALTFE